MRKKVVFSSLLVVSTAVAAYCCDPWGLPVQQVFIQVGQTVAKTLTAASNSINTVLAGTLERDFHQGLSKAGVELTKQTAEKRVMAGGLLAVEASLDAQRVVAESQEQSKPAAQQDTTVTNAILHGEMSPIVADKIRGYDQAWSNAYLSPSPVDIGHSMLARHQPYCSPKDVEVGVCDKAAIPALQNADLTINSIYQPGNGQYDTLSDQEHAAALAFVQTLTQPAPYSPPGKAMKGAATDLSVQLVQDQATLALVAHSLHSQIADRTRRHQ